jgi:hypothetical protein
MDSIYKNIAYLTVHFTKNPLRYLLETHATEYVPIDMTTLRGEFTTSGVAPATPQEGNLCKKGI